MYYNIFFYERFSCFEKVATVRVIFSGAPLLGDMEFFWDITEGGQNKRGLKIKLNITVNCAVNFSSVYLSTFY